MTKGSKKDEAQLATGVTIIPPPATSLAPADLAANDRDLRDARSDRTQREYAKHWSAFSDWCAAHGHAAMPVELPVLAAYLRGLREGTATKSGKGYAPASIEVALSAITTEHRLAGYAINRKASQLADFVKANKRKAGEKRTERRVAPLRARDLQTIIAQLRRDEPADIRDRALLTIGFAAALRRVELSGLDFGQIGTGTGFITADDRGIRIALTTSKTMQGETIEVFIPCIDMRSACDAVQAWLRFAKPEPGSPLFRAISKGGNVLADRLGPSGIVAVIKGRVYAAERAQGATEAEARAKAAEYSGHSMRAGFVTSAAEASLPTYKIQEQSRHASADTVKRYIRDADGWNDNPLKKIGF